MNAVERFQRQHGATYAALSKTPAFLEALQVANYLTIQKIGGLTDEQIKENGSVILAELKGRLAHEDELIKLSVAEPKGIDDIEADYPSVEEELLAEEAQHPNGNSDIDFISRFQAIAPQRTTNPPDKKISVKEKRQQNAAKAREAKQKKYRERLKAKLSKSPKG